MSRFLILAGILLIAIGLILHFRVEIPYLTSWIGKLPGDIVIKKKNATIYFPIATSLLISFVLSLVLSVLFSREK